MAAGLPASAAAEKFADDLERVASSAPGAQKQTFTAYAEATRAQGVALASGAEPDFAATANAKLAVLRSCIPGVSSAFPTAIPTG